MSNPNFPSETPNVHISNPRIRRAIRLTLDSIGGLLFIAMAVDASTEALNWLAVTVPALAGWTAARVVFGFSVDDSNTPK